MPSTFKRLASAFLLSAVHTLPVQAQSPDSQTPIEYGELGAKSFETPHPDMGLNISITCKDGEPEKISVLHSSYEAIEFMAGIALPPMQEYNGRVTMQFYETAKGELKPLFTPQNTPAIYEQIERGEIQIKRGGKPDEPAMRTLARTVCAPQS